MGGQFSNRTQKLHNIILANYTYLSLWMFVLLRVITDLDFTLNIFFLSSTKYKHREITNEVSLIGLSEFKKVVASK